MEIIQLVLKEIMTADEFDEIKDFIQYDFSSDSHFTELKDAEILRERLDSLGQVSDYVGKYFSQEYVRKYVLRQSDEDIEMLDKQIQAEKDAGLYDQEDDGGF